MKILIVDHDPASRDALRRAFAEAGDQVRCVATLPEGERQMADLVPDAVIGALDFPGAEGVRFLESAAASDPDLALYALVGGSDLEEGVRAMTRGARDFFWRPVSVARVGLLRSRLLASIEREEKLEETRLRLARAEIAGSFAGRSAPWQAALASIEREAAAGEPVLITGESGTEKEAAARALHRLSARGSEAFAVASAEVPLSQPTVGTLFLPGIERAKASLQRQILSDLARPSGRRLILGTDQDPRERTAGGLLPELSEALRDHVVHLPPLRERGADVELLARRFLYDLGGSLTFDAEAMDSLVAHDWPGNVEELREVVQRAALLAEGPAVGATVVRSLLGRPPAARRSRRKRGPVVRIAVGDSLAEVERRLIQRTLAFARGNKKKTAELLKLSLKTIYNKIKEYGLEH